MSEILLYQTPDGEAKVEVNVDQETVWLSQQQMSELFGRERSVISKHLGNIFREEELDEESNVQKMHIAGSDRPVAFYNLDVIISVGYRVKSHRGTQFRIWATNVLREHLLKGYTLNEKSLRAQASRYNELQGALRLLRQVTEVQHPEGQEAAGLLRVLTDYAYALEVLDRYDHQQLRITGTTLQQTYELSYEEALQAIAGLRQRYGAGPLFGREKDASFHSSVRAIYQTFGDEELYPSIEEKAAHLLYFVTKNHSFSDGNKRIAAFLFVYFLDRNGCLYRPDGSRLLADNALVALTLMIAESKPEEKEVMVRVIVNLINHHN